MFDFDATPIPLEITDPELHALLLWHINYNLPEYFAQKPILKWKKEHRYELCLCGSTKKAKFCDCEPFHFQTLTVNL